MIMLCLSFTASMTFCRHLFILPSHCLFCLFSCNVRLPAYAAQVPPSIPCISQLYLFCPFTAHCVIELCCFLILFFSSVLF
ncbi:hypothetical protein BDY19DRAFT_913967 [Irpex rosettiformis]|uniref:Uncharacterized protein n=1 Tax=Irpex rosettiformis TaxID=378272 RepID=A0ACB8ULV0_9APHY|nr:hypothetical protein BDY19DRAFT_913967 [Irpex rosettiformis]